MSKFQTGALSLDNAVSRVAGMIRNTRDTRHATNPGGWTAVPVESFNLNSTMGDGIGGSFTDGVALQLHQSIQRITIRPFASIQAYPRMLGMGSCYSTTTFSAQVGMEFTEAYRTT